MESANLAPGEGPSYDFSMPQKSLGAGLLVLLELGATWPRALVETSVHGSKRVLVELEGEGPEAFAERVAAVAGSLFPRGVLLELVVLACNERADAPAIAARRAILKALLSRRSLPRVVFACGDEPRESFRQSLATLADELGQRERSRTSFALRESVTDAMARVA